MNWSKKNFNIIKKLKPIQLLEIMTRGIDLNLEEETIKLIEDDWIHHCVVNFQNIYISDSGIEILTTYENAKKIYSHLFKWRIFEREWCREVPKHFQIENSQGKYLVGFNWNSHTFEFLYKEWLRDDKLKK